MFIFYPRLDSREKTLNLDPGYLKSQLGIPETFRTALKIVIDSNL